MARKLLLVMLIGVGSFSGLSFAQVVIEEKGNFCDGAYARGVEVIEKIAADGTKQVLAYVSSGTVPSGDFHGIKIIDVTDPENPREIASSSYLSPSTFGFNSVVNKVEDRYYCYFVDYKNMHIFDVTDNSFIHKATVSSGDGNATWSDIRVIGNYAYIAGKPNGLTIFDVSNPTNPKSISYIINGYRHPSEGDPNGLDVVFNDDGEVIVFLANDRYGLDIFDATNPEVLKHLFHWEDSNVQTERVQVVDDTVYIAAEERGLVILNLDDNYQVIGQSSYPEPFANGITVEGRYAYVCDGFGRDVYYNGQWVKATLKIVDVEQSPPSLVYALPKYECNVCDPTDDCNFNESEFLGNRLYVASRWGGLRIYEFPKAIVDLHPRTLNLKSKGRYVTAYITLPEGYDVSNIDISTIEIVRIDNDEIDPSLPVLEGSPTQIGDYNEDSIPDLMVKFDRQKLQEYLSLAEGENEVFKKITIIFTLFDGSIFEVSDKVRVIKRGR